MQKMPNAQVICREGSKATSLHAGDNVLEERTQAAGKPCEGEYGNRTHAEHELKRLKIHR